MNLEDITENAVMEMERSGTNFKLGDILSGLWIVEDGDAEQDDVSYVVVLPNKWLPLICGHVIGIFVSKV